ncbi:MAG: flagellar protein FlaG [Clostridium sp.]|nr:flagellar protein FlaG [Clostridium sp.]
MGIDGFSLSNLGLNRNLSSSQLADEAERTARQSLENQIADADGVGKIEKAGRKDPDAAFNGTIPFIPDDKKENDDNNEQEQPDSEEQQSNDTSFETNSDDEEEYSKYHFRFNKENMIEIYDSEKKEVIKTISPEDASKALLNLSKMPGLFVNKKV